MKSRHTAKQVLMEHIESRHGGFATRQGGLRRRPHRSWTLERMASWHAYQHHRYVTNHYHAGPNTDANNRPPGWRTGEDVKEIP